MIRTRGRKAYRRPGSRSAPARPIDRARAERLTELAAVYLATQQPQLAVEALRGALVLSAADSEARLALARALYHAGDFDTALAWLRSPADRADAELLRGQVLADKGDLAGAVLAFGQALTAQSNLLEARLRRASVRIAAGDPVGALPDLDTALEQSPESVWARTLRALGRLEAGLAQAALEDLAQIDPVRRGAFHALLEARAKLLAGCDEGEVDRAFSAGLKRHPADARLSIAFARHLLARLGTDPDAGRAAREQLKPLLDRAGDGLPAPQRAEALFLLAEIAAAEDFEQAEALFHQGLGLAPDDPAGLSGLGGLLLDRGRPAHALPWLLRAALVDPEHPRTAELLARAMQAIPDDDAVARWLGLLVSGLPRQSPQLLARLMRFVQENGRGEAYEDVRRHAHRMKNKVAVLASRSRIDSAGVGLSERLTELYEDWSRFLQTIRRQPPALRLLAPARLVRLAVEQAVARPERLVCQLPSGLPLIRGDEDQLVDALANLLTNAFQATPENKPVRLVAREREPNRWLEIAVTDEGPGISPEDRARVFALGTTSKPEGSGVGLAVAQRAVLSHGGRISVASAPGGPTTFAIRLPVASAQLPLAWPSFETLALERFEAGGRNGPG